MGKYYFLVAGLPNIALEDTKPTFTVSEFKNELIEQLSSKDMRIVNLFYNKFDNRNLLAFLKKGENAEFDERGLISKSEILEVYKQLKNEEKVSFSKHFPKYLLSFLKEYVEQEAEDLKTKNSESPLSLDDRLAASYYAFSMKCENKFIADWFEMNLNISNILTAVTCKKHNLDKTKYIVGENEVALQLLHSNARDFGLGDDLEYLAELLRLADEEDLIAREKKIDTLKWCWLDDHTFFKTFDLESVFAYLLKLDMIERWTVLDKEKGEKTFREIVMAMKKGSINTLEEFKKNNNK